MAKQNHIAKIRKSKGLTQAQLADLVGAHWITISRLERGIMQLTGDWMDRLAQALGVDVNELWGDSKRKMIEVLVPGVVTGGHIVLDREASETMGVVLAEPPNIEAIVWIEVGDQALQPFFFPKELIAFAWVPAPNLSAYLSRMVLVQSEPNTTVIGVLVAVNEGSIDLRTFGGMLTKSLEYKNIAVFSGCHVFWHREPTKLI